MDLGNLSGMLRILIPLVLLHLTVLVGIVFFLKKMLLGDTMNAINRLKQVEAEVKKKEQSIRQEIEGHKKEFEAKQKEAEEKLQEQREKSEEELARTREQMLAEAGKESEKIMATARKNEERLRTQIAQDMEEKAVDYGTEVFKLVFSEEMNAELNKHFIGELLDALDDLDAASITVDTDDVQFTTSHAIVPEQKQRLEELLKNKFGAEIKVEEKIDEELLGGMIFKLGSLEIDGSLSNRLKEASAEVKKTAHA